MEIQKSEAVVYVDGYGREHDALLTALNPMNAGFATLVYVDVNAPEPDNVKKLFDVAHVSHISKDETNPDLPSYDVNCWKQSWERHKALPADHPAFDHPFVEPKYDEAGQRVAIERPATEAEIAEHQAERTAIADLEQAASVPVQSQSPDYAALRKQLNDYTSTFYGPHACDCPAFSGNREVIRRAVEQGGEMYSERDPNLGLPRYEQHTCAKPTAPEPQTSAEPPCASAEAGIACNEPQSAHTPEAAKGDVGMDHDFVPPPAEEGQSE